MNFQSAVLGSGESLLQWSDRVLTLAFPQLPNMHAQAIPRLCHGAEDKDAGMYAPEAVDQMHFFQHSRQGLPPKPNA